MRLDRNLISGPRNGKYAILKLRKLREAERVHSPQGLTEIEHAIKVLETAGILDWGDTEESEFFLIRLKDKYADDALYRYSLAAKMDGEGDYAREIEEMAARAGINHPLCKKPD